MYNDIAVQRTDKGIGLILIDRSDGKNAVRAETLAEICNALDEMISNDSIVGIVLAAEGRHFVAGADFQFLEGLKKLSSLEVKAQIYTKFQGAARRIYHCPKPTVAAVQGAAITVGCELAVACDFRICSERAIFQESWIRLGLMPPLGGLFLLPRIVGLARASEMVLQGRAVKAEEAKQMGLVNELLPEEQLRDRAIALAEELSALPPQAYQIVKESLHRGMESSMDKEWGTNVLAQAALIASDDFAEGLEAVKEKRQGVFKGS